MPQPILPQAFSIRFSGLASVLVCDVGVGSSELVNVNNVKPVSDKSALWDTGATSSVISKKLAHELGLVPTGRTMWTGVNGSFECNKYVVDIYLPSRVRVRDVLVTESSGIPYDLLIGMDIIRLGDFALTHTDGLTIFSYQIPSTHQIDFVDEVNELGRKIAKNKANNSFKRGISRIKKKKRK